MVTVAERLKQIRDRLGYSQDGMAASIGMKQRTWADWEKKPPQALLFLRKLVEKHEMSADYLIGLTDDPTTRGGPSLSPEMQEVIGLGQQLSMARQQDLLAITKTFIAQEPPGSSVADAQAKATGRKQDAPRIIGEE